MGSTPLGVEGLDRLGVGQDLVELAGERLALLGGEREVGEPRDVVDGLDGHSWHADPNYSAPGQSARRGGGLDLALCGP